MRYLSISDLRKAASSVGELPMTIAPRSAMRAVYLGERTMRLISAVSLSSTSFGVAAGALLDHLGGAHQNGIGNFDAERSGGFHVNDHIESGGQFDWQIAGLCALENLVHIGRGTAK